MSTPKISIIAAVAKNLAIGKNNQLLWHLPDDLKRFNRLTSGHAVIMGNRTFESLGRPLPRRTNIVIAKDENYSAPGCIVVHSLDEAVAEAKKVENDTHPSLSRGAREGEGGSEIFVIGGGSIYKQFLPRADKLYITRVDKDFDADTFFPAYEGQFKKIVFREEHEYNGLKFTYLDLER